MGRLAENKQTNKKLGELTGTMGGQIMGYTAKISQGTMFLDDTSGPFAVPEYFFKCLFVSLS